ncbi:serine hydrolase domain-containing protein [Qipengyuania sp. ASV99]|uniref:serine hydrolase domain-containing protein n=1 Tax=Qipengyuania sp. ASV99 TaxID=3399681 RepID=UPI003A4C5D29
MKYFLILLAVLFGVAAPANARMAAIHAFAAEAWEESGAPGAAYAVIDGNATQSAALGITQSGGDIPVSPKTPFRIGSITKSFTAIAIMQLVEAGKVDLDAPASLYLEIKSETSAQPITLRQLLSHTSGFSTVQGNALHDASGTQPATLAALAARLFAQGPAYPPGTRWEYSNANYQLLGAVIEAVSGTAYETYIKDRIFTPLGLPSGQFAYEAAQLGAAIGHRPWFGGHRPFDDHGDSRLNAPAGGILLSATDLATYLAVMMNGEDDIVSAATKTRMLAPASDIASFYGLGWFLDAEAGTVFHGGLVPGSEALATMMPDAQKAVVVLVNTNGGIGFGESTALRNGTTAMALDLPYAGEGTRWVQKLTYLSVMLLPLFYLGAMVFAWIKRRALRAKRTSLAGMFSVWFPLLMMTILAFVLLWLVPQMFGGSIGTILLYQPDFGAAMTIGAILGLGWACFRIFLAYSRNRSIAL